MDSSALEIEAFRDGIARLELKLTKTTDPEAKEAIVKRLEVLRAELDSRTGVIPKITRPAAPAPAPAEPAQAPAEPRAEDERPSVPPTSGPKPIAPAPISEKSELDQVEKILREAQVERMRGNKVRTQELIAKALEIAPESPTVLEACAESYLEARQTKKALETLKRVVELDPNNVAAERKYAQLVLGANPMSDAAMRRALSDNPFIGAEDVVASARGAVLLSVIVPGAGQFVLGETGKGIFIFCGWLVSAFVVFLLRADLQAVFSMAGVHAKGAGTGAPSFLVFVALLAALIFHFSSIIGAMTTGKTSSISIKKDRPEPLANLPFD
ncbi:MAG: tetratricopeptide repeat protein [Fimbriimonas sp.]